MLNPCKMCCQGTNELMCCCYRSKMGPPRGSNNNVPTTMHDPQASCSSSGRWIGEVDAGIVINDSGDEGTITVGEENRDGVVRAGPERDTVVYELEGMENVETISDLTNGMVEKNESSDDRFQITTSTPLRKSQREKIQCRKKKKIGRYVKKARKDKLRKKLEEAAGVGLSSTNSELDEKDRGMSDNENDTNLSFDSLSPGFNDHLRKFLEKHDCPATSPNGTETQWGSSSDPSIEGAILGLVDPESSYNNPFQLTDEIRREVVRRTASSGERALDWSLNSFDMVGGENTLRSVWAKLKSKHRVKGNKRAAENHDSTSDDDIKRCKRSLNMSSTCIDLGNINIQTSSSSEGVSLIKCMSLNEDIEVLRESCEIGMVECGGDSECSREYLGSNEFSSSDSIPGLTSSESSPLSSDSGRSETWAGSNGIWGERNAKRSDIIHGIVTETERNPSVVEGFETDDVVEYDTSNDVYQGIAAYVSSTTDEGVYVGELETLYNDDVVLDLNTSHEMVEHVSASEESEQYVGASRHGMPSIAESEAIDPSADELIDTSHGRLSIASNLWGGFGYVQSDASDVDSDHGEPSIAGYQWFLT